MTEIEAIVLSVGFTVNIYTSESFDDLVEFYPTELGAPTALLDAPEKSALWIKGTLALSILDEGSSRLVNATQTG